MTRLAENVLAELAIVAALTLGKLVPPTTRVSAARGGAGAAASAGA